MRRSLRAAVAAGALGAGLAVSLILAQSPTRAAGLHNTPGSAATTGTFTEFVVPTASSVPESIVTGPDGNLWFTEYQASGAIGRITPAGTVTEFAITTPNSGPFWITAGPDGNLWFTEGSANKIGKISPAGVMLGEFAVPTVNSGPSNIVAGPDGNLWFTELYGDAIGKITTAGVLTEVAHLSVGAGPTGIVVGPDGNLWFAEQYANKIGKVTTAGTVTEFVIAAGRTPAEIAAGPDGNLWFTEFDGNRIGKITTAGSVTEFAVPTASSQPGSIATGIDGNLWFTEQSGNKVGRITSDGTITEFGPIPTAGSGPGGINPGPDGNLWFTERLGNKIGRLTLTCDTWLGTVDGNFGTAGNWSTGAVPTSADDVCITATTKTGPAAKFDTYTVLLNGTFTIHSLALGGPNGTQTLVIPASGVALNLNASSSIGANGVLTMGDAGTGTSALCCAGTTLTNTGHLNTMVGGGGSRFLRLNLTNTASGIVDIGAATSQDGVGGATTTTNNATLILEKAQTLALTGGSTFTQGFGGTLATTIDVTATTFGRLTAYGALVSVDGLLKVTTVGSPPPGSPWPIISSANVLGRFASLDFGPLNYTIQYSASAVTLYGLAPCDYWIGGDGNFNTATNWSYGTVPTSADDVCIDRNTNSTPKAALDTYTVVVDSNFTVNTLTLGPRFGSATLQLAGNNTQFFLNNTSSINAGGTLNVGDNNVANGYTWLGNGGGSSTVLINAGRLNTVQGGGGIRYLRINLNNFTGGTMDIAASDTRQDTATTTINNSTFTVEPGVTFAISNGGAFTNLQGTVTNNGTFSQTGATFTERAGSETGNPILLAAILDDDLSAGPAKFTLNCPNCPPQLMTGTSTQPGIAAGQVVTIPSNNTQVDVGVGFTNAGTLNLGDAGSVQNVLRAGNGGASLTNTGHLNIVQGGGGVRYLRIPITNGASGTVDIAAADTRLDAAYTFTNYGTVTVEVGAGFQILNGGAFSNLGGSVTNNGSFSQTGSTFTQRGGTETGNPIFLQGAILDDDLTAGSAKFLLSGGDITGSGSQPGVATGQVVTIAGDGIRVLLDKSLTNAGTINLGDAGTGYSWLGMGTNNIVLTNTGHLNTVPGGGGVRFLRFSITNAAAGIVDLAAPDSRQDFSAASTINNGLFIIESGTTFSLSTGSTFTQGATGTFQTTIDANAAKFGQLNGGGDTVTLDGKLRVITVGHPAVGSSWPIIANAVRSGTFASSDICAPDYNVEYASTGVTLTLRAIFYTTQSTAQKRLTDSDGATWVDMDPAQLSLTFTPPADSYAILSGNADLWTSAAGYNQDLGISVSGGIYPTLAGQPEAWKESGGYAGTFSPNAAFVQTVVLLKQGQPYTVTLVWKANVKALGATIWAGAGPIGTKFSPTRLTVQLLPSSTSNLKSATITNQRTQSGSDGATWKDLDPGLSFQYTPCVNGMAVLSGNVDLWTSVRGFNQDVGISVSGGTAYPTKAGQPEAWKESGGFAGTFSPNAAFVQTMIPLNANTTYTIKLSWKANKQSPASAAIWAGAGPIGSQFSPTRLQLQFFPSTVGPAGVVDKATKQQFGQVASDGATWQNLDALTLPIQSATACTAIISANADLWTDTPGYNQDIGILVLGGGYPTVQLQPEAWKESGGNAGTYSPNAAFVQMVLPMAANTQYTVTVQWKANRQSPAFAGIWTGAGPIGSDFSPTRLTVQLLGCT
jgi:streptogramin lyase